MVPPMWIIALRRKESKTRTFSWLKPEIVFSGVFFEAWLKWKWSSYLSLVARSLGDCVRPLGLLNRPF